jgi:hypothetical protein
MKAVLVTTEYRGVFFGYVPKDSDTKEKTMELKDARCAIRWSTTKGFLELAEDGPNSKSLIGAKADILLHGITSVSAVTKKAEKKWISR